MHRIDPRNARGAHRTESSYTSLSQDRELDSIGHQSYQATIARVKAGQTNRTEPLSAAPRPGLNLERTPANLTGATNPDRKGSDFSSEAWWVCQTTTEEQVSRNARTKCLHRPEDLAADMDSFSKGATIDLHEVRPSATRADLKQRAPKAITDLDRIERYSPPRAISPLNDTTDYGRDCAADDTACVIADRRSVALSEAYERSLKDDLALCEKRLESPADVVSEAWWVGQIVLTERQVIEDAQALKDDCIQKLEEFAAKTASDILKRASIGLNEGEPRSTSEDPHSQKELSVLLRGPMPMLGSPSDQSADKTG